VGCEDEHDDYDHKPPAGKGAMIVDNDTFNDISVFVDGRRLEEVRDDKKRIYDLDPGVYRVVLEEQGGRRSFRDDIDILDGRNTVLDVHSSGSSSRYDVLVFFD
jgi:hypothetical protein